MNRKVAFKLGEIATVLGVAALCAALTGCQTVKSAVESVPLEWYEKAAAAIFTYFAV